MTSDTTETQENGAPETAAFSLATILDEDSEHLEHPDFKGKPEGGWDEEVKEGVVAQGYCVECEGSCFSDELPASCLCGLNEWVPFRSTGSAAL